MSKPIPKLPALDVLRASAALLGILFHASLSFFVRTEQLNMVWLTNPAHQSFIFDYLLVYLHMFRMPTFFFISGFFTCFVFNKYGLYGLCINRSKRILLPFLVLWLLVNGSTLISWLFLNLTATSAKLPPLFLLIDRVDSFWFLYDLILINSITAIFIMIINKIKKKSTGIWHQSLFSFILLFGSVLIMLALKVWIIPPEITLVPNLSVLLYYMTFFYFGWLIAINLEAWRLSLMSYWHYYFLAAFLAFCLYMILLLHVRISDITRAIAVLNYNIVAWCMIFGSLGLCFKKINREHSIIRYLADSAYWIYISQLPVIIFLQMLLLNARLPAVLQYILICSLTIIFCLATYQLIIRKRKIFRYIDGH